MLAIHLDIKSPALHVISLLHTVIQFLKTTLALQNNKSFVFKLSIPRTSSSVSDYLKWLTEQGKGQVWKMRTLCFCHRSEPSHNHREKKKWMESLVHWFIVSLAAVFTQSQSKLSVPHQCRSKLAQDTYSNATSTLNLMCYISWLWSAVMEVLLNSLKHLEELYWFSFHNTNKSLSTSLHYVSLCIIVMICFLPIAPLIVFHI